MAMLTVFVQWLNEPWSFPFWSNDDHSIIITITTRKFLFWSNIVRQRMMTLLNYISENLKCVWLNGQLIGWREAISFFVFLVNMYLEKERMWSSRVFFLLLPVDVVVVVLCSVQTVEEWCYFALVFFFLSSPLMQIKGLKPCEREHKSSKVIFSSEGEKRTNERTNNPHASERDRERGKIFRE